MSEAVDVGNVSNVIMSLVLVVGFIFAAAFVVRRMPFAAFARGQGPLKVLATLPLGPRERLVLVQAHDAELLIAVSPAGVFNLSGANAGATSPMRAAATPSVFSLGAEPQQ
jgi:flagellar protein FliO/FliZ